DIKKCVVFDLEVSPGRWCVGFHGPDPRGDLATQVVDGDASQLAALLKRLADNGRILVGYNSERFDVPVILGILRGEDPYELAQAIIREERGAGRRTGLPQLPCDHIDLSARLRRGGGFPSLKGVAANLGRPVLRELPYPPDAILSDEQW